MNAGRNIPQKKLKRSRQTQIIKRSLPPKKSTQGLKKNARNVESSTANVVSIFISTATRATEKPNIDR